MTDRKNGLTLTLAAAVLGLGSAFLGGCNTMQGAGKDVEAAGTAVQRESCEHNPTDNKDCKPAP
jgi:predicted small secreted protein